MVSAVQVEGRRLHELARAGIEVERAPRPVTVHQLRVGEPIEPGCFPIDVVCSSGTYVRSLAADLGRALGGGAHLRDLRRTAIGSFGLDEAVPVEALAPDRLLPPVAAVRDLGRVVVPAAVAAEVAHGKVLERSRLTTTEGDGPWPIVAEDGRLLAVYERHRGSTVKPAVVLASPDDGAGS
jgi:tRNA pseudouridine55 synthase